MQGRLLPSVAICSELLAAPLRSGLLYFRGMVLFILQFIGKQHHVIYCENTLL